MESKGACAECATGTVHEGTPVGSFITLADLDCYYSPPPGEGKFPYILLITDIFGCAFINNKLMADQIAAAGYHVYMPDYLQADALKESDMLFMETPNKNCCTRVWKFFQILKAIPKIIPVFRRHGDAVSKPQIQRSLTALKELSTARGNGKLGCVGFCWGGRHTIVAVNNGNDTLIDSYCACHAGQVKVPGDISNIRRPGLICQAPGDFSLKAEQVARDILSSDHNKAEIIVYPNVNHGFVIRGGPDSLEARNDARKKMIEFFNKTLKL